MIFKKPKVVVVFKGRRKILSTCLNSTMKARRMLNKGCKAFLTHVVEVKPAKLKPKDVPMVCEYLDVFSKELSRLPFDREVEFTIDVIPGTTPIFQAPYHMALGELKELKVHLQELVDEVISDRVFPHGLHQYYL